MIRLIRMGDFRGMLFDTWDFDMLRSAFPDCFEKFIHGRDILESEEICFKWNGKVTWIVKSALYVHYDVLQEHPEIVLRCKIDKSFLI